jgi:hypothetical protein
MAKSAKISSVFQVGLAKSTRRSVAQIRARWSVEEARQRRQLAALLQRHLSFISSMENC